MREIIGRAPFVGVRAAASAATGASFSLRGTCDLAAGERGSESGLGEEEIALRLDRGGGGGDARAAFGEQRELVDLHGVERSCVSSEMILRSGSTSRW